MPPRWGFHRAIGPGATFFVAAAVQRGDHAAGDLAGFFENGRCSVFINHFSQGRQLGPQLGNFKHFIEHEAHIAQGSFVVSHLGSLE
jgi:hypothetical protein